MVEAGAAEQQALRYQAVIARQKESINRLLILLEERNADVAEHMERASQAAVRWGRGPDEVDMLMFGPPLHPESGTTVTIDTDTLDRLSAEQATNAHMTAQLAQLTRWYDAHPEFHEDAMPNTSTVQHILRVLQTLMSQRDKERAEVRNLVALTKSQPMVADPAETPPWEQPGYRPPEPISRVVPATVDRHTVMQDPMSPLPGSADTETLAFDLSTAGEQRPGSF